MLGGSVFEATVITSCAAARCPCPSCRCAKLSVRRSVGLGVPLRANNSCYSWDYVVCSPCFAERHRLAAEGCPDAVSRDAVPLALHECMSGAGQCIYAALERCAHVSLLFCPVVTHSSSCVFLRTVVRVTRRIAQKTFGCGCFDPLDGVALL